MKIYVPLWLGVATASAILTWCSIALQFALPFWQNASWSQDASYNLWGITNVTALFVTPVMVFLAAFSTAHNVARAKRSAEAEDSDSR
jgi:uncharacterized BrkB/YihY/UPF0761 family membrane protein